MRQPEPATLKKRERLHSQKLIETLFSGGRSKSASAFPLRVVYMPLGEEEGPAQMLVSVPKRYFKRAVKRNRVKRQVREAFRRNKQLLKGKPVALAFIWTGPELVPSHVVESKVKSLLSLVGERLEVVQEENAEKALDTVSQEEE
jgi:ribonuclease P protein component